MSRLRALYKSKKIVYNMYRKTTDYRTSVPTERNAVIMKSKIRDEKIDYLFRGILTLDSMEDCYNFFEDLCTVSELKEMSRRMLAAKMLRENYIYSEIAAQTGLSTATISRVNRCLKYGNDGYLSVLERIEKRRNS